MPDEKLLTLEEVAGPDEDLLTFDQVFGTREERLAEAKGRQERLLGWFPDLYDMPPTPERQRRMDQQVEGLAATGAVGLGEAEVMVRRAQTEPDPDAAVQRLMPGRGQRTIVDDVKQWIRERTGLFEPPIYGGPTPRIERPLHTIAGAGLHISAEAVSGLGLNIPDIVASRLTAAESLAEAVDQLTGFKPRPAEIKAGERVEFVYGLQTANGIAKQLVGKIAAREALKRILAAGLTFAGRQTSEEVALKIINGDPIEAEKIWAAGGVGVLFGITEVALAKGVERWTAGKMAKEYTRRIPGLQQIPKADRIKMAQAALDSHKVGQGRMTLDEWHNKWSDHLTKFSEQFKNVAVADAKHVLTAKATSPKPGAPKPAGPAVARPPVQVPGQPRLPEAPEVTESGIQWIGELRQQLRQGKPLTAQELDFLRQVGVDPEAELQAIVQQEAAREAAKPAVPAEGQPAAEAAKAPTAEGKQPLTWEDLPQQSLDEILPPEGIVVPSYHGERRGDIPNLVYTLTSKGKIRFTVSGEPQGAIHRLELLEDEDGWKLWHVYPDGQQNIVPVAGDSVADIKEALKDMLPPDAALAKPAPAPEAKQPWEMTREEYFAADETQGEMTLAEEAVTKARRRERVVGERLDRGEAIQEEYRAATESLTKAIERRDELASRFFAGHPELLGPSGEVVSHTHRDAVKNAVQQGHPVPRHVLQEYAGEPWADAALAKAPPTTEAEPPTKEAEPPTKPPAAAKGEKAGDAPKIAKFRKMTETLDRQIEDKRRPMTQNPTPKRMKEYRSRLHDAENLDRLRQLLNAMADASEAGRLPTVLEPYMKKPKGELQRLVYKGITGEGGYYDVIPSQEYSDTSEAGKAAQKLIEKAATAEQQAAQAERDKRTGLERLEDEVRFVKIPGFFPTPKAVIKKMLAKADLQREDNVLEPSAGKGDIADAIAEHPEGPSKDYIATAEIRPKLQEILKAKGYTDIKSDFLEMTMEDAPRGGFDKIVMNPPFEKGQDVDHVLHAYELLKPGGRLVALMSEGTFFKAGKKFAGFREFLDSVGGEATKLTPGAFKGIQAFRQTGVAARMVVIDKPAPKAAGAKGLPDLAKRSVEHISGEYYKGNLSADEAIAALTAKDKAITSDPKNQLKDQFNKYTPEARRKTNAIAWAIQRILTAEKAKAAGAKGEVARYKGILNVAPIGKLARFILGGVEPARITIGSQGKDVYTEVVKAIEGPEPKTLTFDEKTIDAIDREVAAFEKELDAYDDKTLDDLMLTRGHNLEGRARQLQRQAFARLPKELKESKIRRAIDELADYNHEYLRRVFGDDVGYVEDYFYGLYKNSRKVSAFLKFWRTTDRYTKQKAFPTYAEARAHGLKVRDPNPVRNLRREFQAIARREAMMNLRDNLLEHGTGRYIDEIDKGPDTWDVIGDPMKPEPAFAGLVVEPDLAQLINRLISTNKITQHPVLNTFRKISTAIRGLKFTLSAFHAVQIGKQSIADTGYFQFYRKTSARGVQSLFKKFIDDPAYKDIYREYMGLGGTHRYSIEFEAQRAFTNMMRKLTKTERAIINVPLIPVRILERFVRWMFEDFIPNVKFAKYMDLVAEREAALGRPLADAEKVDIIKEIQNFYGMVNERLYGRSATMTTALRFQFLAPGYPEGNYRTMVKAASQWGVGEEGYRATRSRTNIINSWTLTATLATIGTLIMTGKLPKRPKSLEEARDLLKIDTGKTDEYGRRVMIDLATYDKDYWNVMFNMATGHPIKAAQAVHARIGTMTAPMFHFTRDMVALTLGEGLYDWKHDEVYYPTDPTIKKITKVLAHEIRRLEPISVSVFQRSREKEIDVAVAALETMLGLRPTYATADLERAKAIRDMWSMRDQREKLSIYLGRKTDPWAAVKEYNDTVHRILDRKFVTDEMRKEWSKKLLIDPKKVVNWKRFPAHAMTDRQIRQAIREHTYKEPYRRDGRLYPPGHPHKGYEDRVKELRAELKAR